MSDGMPREWRALIERMNAWKHLDWTVEADGYRLVIEDGAMTGLAYDEFPWPWGDPRYDEITVVGSWRGSMADPFPDSTPLTVEDLADCDPLPDPGGYRFFALSPLMISDDGVHFYEAGRP